MDLMFIDTRLWSSSLGRERRQVGYVVPACQAIVSHSMPEFETTSKARHKRLIVRWRACAKQELHPYKMAQETFPVSYAPSRQRNNPLAELVEMSIRAGEGQLTRYGALGVETGEHTGRSAQDKFTVRDATTEGSIWWDNNKPMAPEHFDRLYEDFLAHAKGRDLYVQDLYAGADAEYRLNARIFVEKAWHALFIRHMLRRPERDELEDFAPQFTVVNLPSFRADPARHGCRSETVIACNFTKKLVLIGGSLYA